ncbi:MAG: xanthine dehydrogenase family protein molybdopterin-binding subunit, partial [Hyphomicrobiaceae bacterium]
MSATGIGARVERKEDKRFITGKGRYTDDFSMPGMHHAVFVRSDQAHATIKSIDKSDAEGMPGVIAVLDGGQLTGDGVGNLICGWMIHSKDGSPMNMGAWSALATDKVRYVGDAVVVVIAESKEAARNAAETVVVDYDELPVVVDAKKALQPGAPQIHENAPGNLIYDWEIGDGAAVDAAISSAAHVTTLELSNNRLVPNAMEPRAALASYDAAEE